MSKQVIKYFAFEDDTEPDIRFGRFFEKKLNY